MQESSTIPALGDYSAESRMQDQFLDERIARIRAEEDAGHITIREAADARVAALEHHLAAVRNLRAEYFGNGGQ